MVEKLKAAGADAELFIYPGVGHAFMNDSPAPYPSFEERQKARRRDQAGTLLRSALRTPNDDGEVDACWLTLGPPLTPVPTVAQAMGFAPFDSELAELSWQRMIAFFKKHLAACAGGE